MRNELRIRPLMKFQVTYMVSVDQRDQLIEDVFTADDYDASPGRTVFYRTGNPIRDYQAPIVKLIISPVDDEDLADIQE